MLDSEVLGLLSLLCFTAHPLLQLLSPPMHTIITWPLVTSAIDLQLCSSCLNCPYFFLSYTYFY